MLKTRWRVVLGILGLTGTLAQAEQDPAVPVSQPAEKQTELSKKGYTNWQPGQGKIPGTPPFRGLQHPRPASSGGTRDTGTIQYDNGTLSALPTAFGQVFGNRFQSGVGGVPLDTITLNSFSFYFLEDSTSDTSLFFQPADPLNAGSISARGSINISGLSNSGPSFTTPVLNVIPQSSLGTSGMFNDTFYLGAWSLNSASSLPTTNEVIGLATNGPCFNGYTASSAPALGGPVSFSNQAFNAIIRANITSPAAVPVELMRFSVEPTVELPTAPGPSTTGPPATKSSHRD